jgi:hypothetical protein
MPLQSVNLVADISSAGVFVGPATMGVDDSYAGSVSGDFSGHVVLQRSLDGGVTWGNLDEFTEPVEIGGEVTCGCLLQLGVEPGVPFTGTAHVILKVGQ